MYCPAEVSSQDKFISPLPHCLGFARGPQKTEAVGAVPLQVPCWFGAGHSSHCAAWGWGLTPKPPLCAMGCGAGLRLVPEAPHPPGATWLPQPRPASLLMQLPNPPAQ